jgi:hypothetical protein
LVRSVPVTRHANHFCGADISKAKGSIAPFAWRCSRLSISVRIFSGSGITVYQSFHNSPSFYGFHQMVMNGACESGSQHAWVPRSVIGSSHGIGISLDKDFALRKSLELTILTQGEASFHHLRRANLGSILYNHWERCADFVQLVEPWRVQ